METIQEYGWEMAIVISTIYTIATAVVVICF